MIYLLRVTGDSMSPTLNHGDTLLALSTHWRPVKPGRIIAFRRNNQLYIKRALSHEADGWFAVGDNPTRSTDSRRFGPIPQPHIRATALLRLTPLPQPLP